MALQRRGMPCLARPVGEQPPPGLAVAALVQKQSEEVHFVVLESHADGLVLLYSPPHTLTKVRWEKLRRKLAPVFLDCTPPHVWQRSLTLAALVAGTLLALWLWWRLKRGKGGSSVVSTAAVVALLMAAGCTGGREEDAISVWPSTEIDLGTLERGVYVAEVSLHNGSSREITCRQVKTGCSCIVPQIDLSSPIAAGETRRCGVKFDVQPGPSSIVVSFDIVGLGPVRAYLAYQGKIVEGITWSDHLTFENAVPGSPSRKSAWLKASDASLVELGVEPPLPRVRWKLDDVMPIIVHPGEWVRTEDGAWITRAEVELDSEIPGSGKGEIRVGFADQVCPIDVEWNEAFPCQISPSCVLLSPTADGLGSDTLTGEVSIRCDPGSRISSWESDDSALHLEGRSPAEGQTSIAITADCGWARDSGVGSIFVHLQGPDGKTSRLPIRVVAPPPR